MNQETKEKLALFAENAQITKKEFSWNYVLVKQLAALLYTLENKPVRCDAIRESYDLIKGSIGVFSTFRGNMSLCVAAMLSLENNRQDLIERTLSAYELLKSAKFRSSDYLTVAAFQIAAHAEPTRIPQAVQRMRDFYDGMKVQRWFHTGEDDYIFAAMLGLSDIDAAAGTEHIEQLYRQLKPEFRGGNSVQALTQVLVLGGTRFGAAERVLALRDALKRQKIRLDRADTLPSIGILALLPVDIDTIVSDMAEAQTFLRAQKGFGGFSAVSTQELLLFVTAIVASGYADSNLLTASLSTSIASILIAQEAAIIAASSSAATIAATSN